MFRDKICIISRQRGILMNMKEAEYNKRSFEKKVRTRAVAYLRRAKEAGIPERFMRIGREDFQNLLYEGYHKDDSLEEMTSLIYDTPKKIFKLPFIIIDGGDELSRKKAGFALLFRLITCDHTGFYRGCKKLANNLSTWDKTEGVGRNDFVEELKRYDVLFIGEFSRRVMSSYGDAGCFFDDFLEDRFDNAKPTIISFSQPIQESNAIDDLVCGKYLSDLSHKDISDPNPSEDLLRIRVKI